MNYHVKSKAWKAAASRYDASVTATPADGGSPITEYGKPQKTVAAAHDERYRIENELVKRLTENGHAVELEEPEDANPTD